MSTPIRLVEVTKNYRLFGSRSQFQTFKSALLRREMSLPPEATVTALENITFEVNRGEAFGVVGRNGSGKSTLLKLISGILKPTAGGLVVDGRVSALIELGAGFHPEISGRENIVINGIMLGLTRREIEKKFDRIVEFAGIGKYLDQPVKTYSSGMYVRLGFAVAVHVDPDILLIDEVLAVGDEEFSQKCIAKIQELKYRGVTMLFVTHQLDHVRSLCDRALWLDGGRIATIGDPVRVVDDYLQSVSGDRAVSVEKGAVPEERTPVAVSADAIDEPGEEEERWGSGEIVIRRAALLDRKGRELVAIGANAAVTIELDLNVRDAQSDVVIGVGIFHADGTVVYGTNTDLEGFVAEDVSTDGIVRFVISSLDLVAGRYRLDAAVHTRNGRAFDYRRGVLRFVVGSRVHDIGVYRPPHEWQFEGIRFRKLDDIHRTVPAQIAESMREMEPPSKRRNRKKE
jgi:lipopolysaccharide transport system ATP-binding protein